MALPVSDAFIGTDFDTLPIYSANWTNVDGVMEIFSNAYYPNTGSYNASRWNADVFDAEQFAECTIKSLSSSVFIGVGCHLQTDNSANYYYWVGDSATGTYLGEVVAGSGTDLASFTVPSVNDVLRIEVTVSGSIASLVGKINGVSRATTTSTSFVSGSAGVASWGAGTGSRASDFVAGNLASGVTLTVQSSLHAHTVDSPALVQANTLVVDGALHGHTVDVPVLIQANILAVNEALHGHTVGSPVLVQANVLAVDKATHAHWADGLNLIQANTLVVDGSLHAHAVDNLALDISNALVVQGAIHGHTVDSIDLTQASVLSVAGALHDHAAANLDLSQANILTVDSALHAHIVDSVLLNTGGEPLTGDRIVLVTNENRAVLVVDESRLVDVVNEIRRVTFN